MRFHDQVAIITGAASGIGLATALKLGREGARVVLADIAQQKAETAAVEVKRAGAPDAIGLACDVSSEPDVIKTVEAAFNHFNRFDIMVNNAGVMIFKPLEEQTAVDWSHLLGVDLL